MQQAAPAVPGHVVGIARMDHAVATLRVSHMAAAACIKREGKIKHHEPGSGWRRQWGQGWTRWWQWQGQARQQ
jgi:hypothetical protein